MTLPNEILAVRDKILQSQNDRLKVVAEKLITNEPEVIAMWRSLQSKEKKSNKYDFWIENFLEDVQDANSLPTFHYLNKQSRKKLISNIKQLTKEFADILKINDLDFNLIHADGKIFNGFYIYEDFGESNKARIDADDKQKLLISNLIEKIADRTVFKIDNEPQKGKSGKNVKAIRQVRILAIRNIRKYGSPLLTVLATSTNIINGTSYNESDIRKLLSR
jgi:hypothetical protein